MPNDNVYRKHLGSGPGPDLSKLPPQIRQIVQEAVPYHENETHAGVWLFPVIQHHFSTARVRCAWSRDPEDGPPHTVALLHIRDHTGKIDVARLHLQRKDLDGMIEALVSLRQQAEQTSLSVSTNNTTQSHAQDD